MPKGTKRPRQAARKKASKPKPRATAAPRTAKNGGPTVVLIPGGLGQYRVYGGGGKRVPAVSGKASALHMAKRLGIVPSVRREVDSLIRTLRQSKKIG